MLFSIAIPTYNNRVTIGSAIQSAINQLYQSDYEILIVNNASTDGTLEEIQKFKVPNIRVINNPETVDMYSNHNICLKEAKGDYVVFCHSDDKLTEDALLILSKKIEERHYPKRYIVWGRSMFRDFQHSLDKGRQNLNSVFCGERAITALIAGGLTPSGTCYSRESTIEIGGFPSIDVKIPMADWTILITAAYNHFEFEMIDRLLFIREYASTANSLSSEVWNDSIIKSLDTLEKSLDKRQLAHFVRTLKANSQWLFFWYKKYMTPEELRQKEIHEKKQKRKNRIKRIFKRCLGL